MQKKQRGYQKEGKAENKVGQIAGGRVFCGFGELGSNSNLQVSRRQDRPFLLPTEHESPALATKVEFKLT